MITTTNEQLADMGLATIERKTILPSAVAVRVGKGTRIVQHFTSSCSAGEIKKALKAADPKMSNKALARKVNETLRGERDLREQVFSAYTQALFQDGFVPDKGTMGKSSASVRFVKVGDVKAEAAEKAKEATEAKAVALSDENAALVAKIAALSAQIAALAGK